MPWIILLLPLAVWLGRKGLGKLAGCAAVLLTVVALVAALLWFSVAGHAEPAGFCLDNEGRPAVPAGATYIQLPDFHLIVCRPESGAPGGWVDSGIVVATPRSRTAAGSTESRQASSAPVGRGPSPAQMLAMLAAAGLLSAGVYWGLRALLWRGATRAGGGLF